MSSKLLLMVCHCDRNEVEQSNHKAWSDCFSTRRTRVRFVPFCVKRYREPVLQISTQLNCVQTDTISIPKIKKRRLFPGI